MLRVKQFLALVLATILLAVVAITIDGCYSQWPLDRSVQPVSCPLAAEVSGLDQRMDALELQVLQIDQQQNERFMLLGHDIATGLVDVACLYRSWSFGRGQRYRHRNDDPVPSAWRPLSGLIEKIYKETCSSRFR